MATRWEVLAHVMEDINDTDDYGVIAALGEVIRLCHMFDDGPSEYGEGISASALADAIFDELSKEYVVSSWDPAGEGWSAHNRRVEASNAALEETPQTAPEPELKPSEYNVETGLYNPEPDLPALSEDK